MFLDHEQGFGACFYFDVPLGHKRLSRGQIVKHSYANRFQLRERNITGPNIECCHYSHV